MPSKHDRSNLGRPGYFLLQSSDYTMETYMLLAVGEGPWALVAIVKAIRVGVGISKRIK